MRTLTITPESLEECVREARAVLEGGGVILYPTDTLYGLGTDALSDAAVDKVCAIKAREPGKPIYSIVSDMAAAEACAEVTEKARDLAKRFLPGPLSLILKKKQGIETGVARGMDTFGIRIPKHDFCLALARAFGKPFTTTSANIAGKLPEHSTPQILEQLGDRASKIDLVIDAGAVKGAKPSTIVDVSTGALELVREGAIPAQHILDI